MFQYIGSTFARRVTGGIHSLTLPLAKYVLLPKYGTGKSCFILRHRHLYFCVIKQPHEWAVTQRPPFASALVLSCLTILFLHYWLNACVEVIS
jgi:hypothetical protein